MPAQAPEDDALGTILWYENDGQPTPSFVGHVIYDAINYPVSMFAADLDGDGDLDALSASRDDNRILWYENNGDRADPFFTPRTITEATLGAVSVHAADFDGDGDLDVVSASENDDQIAWYENQGQQPPQFATHVIRHTTSPTPLVFDYAKSVVGIDVDGDGDQDIVYGSEHHNQVGWYENDGGDVPAFVDHVVASGVMHVKLVAAADLDLDGDVDLLSASTDDHTVAWYENDGAVDPGFVRHVVSSTAMGARFVHAADLDGDGDMDLLSASRDDNRIAWYANRTIHRSALFTQDGSSLIDQRPEMRLSRPGDMDGDGDLDVVAIGPTAIEWHESNGQLRPSFTRRTVIDGLTDGRWLSVADLDRDGDQDVVYTDADGDVGGDVGGRIGWAENIGGQPPAFVDHGITTGIAGVAMVSVRDLDGDGDPDLYATSDGANGLVWYENVGVVPLQFQARPLGAVASDPRFAEAADLDGDGRVDLVASSFNDDSVRWYRNQGGQPATFLESLIDNAIDGANRVHAVDLDGDGDVDVLSAAELGGAVTWHENLGGVPVLFASRQLDAAQVRSLATADLDRDGDLDIVAGLAEGHGAVWYESDGASPPSYSRHLVQVAGAENAGDAGNEVTLADLDGDADADLLAVDLDAGRLVWLENRGGQYGVEASQVPSTWVKPAVPNELLTLELTHRGRPGDAAVELVSLELQFADADGRPLTTTEIQRRLLDLSVYRSMPGRPFNPGQNPPLATVSPLILDDQGRLTLALPASAGTRLALDSPASFVVAANAVDACTTAPTSLHIQPQISDGIARDLLGGVVVRAEGFQTAGLLTPARVDDKPRLVINEFATEESSDYANPGRPGEVVGWIELFNREYAPVDLSGKHLSNDAGDPTRYRIPDGVQIGARGHLLFVADGNPAAGPAHLPFRLSDDDPVVALHETSANGQTLIDAILLAERFPSDDLPNASWGRYPDGSDERRALMPTPGTGNRIPAGPFKLFVTAVLGGDGCPQP